MSRSYKKSPIMKTSSYGGKKTGKKSSNNTIRNFKEDIPSGGHFKKLFNSREIFEFRWYKPFRKVKEDQFKLSKYSLQYSNEQLIERWKRNYYRK